MRITTILALGLLLPTSAHAASLVPRNVQNQEATSLSALDISVSHADGTAGATIQGFLNVCGKKRGMPYNCAFYLHANLIASDDRGGWTYSTLDCQVRLFATRRQAWFPSEWFGCPSQWNPSGNKQITGPVSNPGTQIVNP